MAVLAEYTKNCLMPWPSQLRDKRTGEDLAIVIIYLHGFNSSPQSHKVRFICQYLQERGLGEEFACPELPPHADQAIAMIEAEMARFPGCRFTFVGSSLGGYYATWLAEQYDTGAVLINPAINPHVGLRDYVGPQQNLYTGQRYELTEAHVQAWERFYVPVITPSRYLLLVETADEVLDYRDAVKRYAGARQVVVAGGDHSFQSFPQYVPVILEFAGLKRRKPRAADLA